MKTKPLFIIVLTLMFCAGVLNFVVAQEPKIFTDECKIEIIKVEAQKALVIKADVPTSEIGPKMGELYGLLFGYLGQKQIQPAGHPFAVYYSFDPSGNTVFEAGVPVSGKIESHGNFLYKEFASMKVVSTLYTGPYEKMENVYIAMQKFLTDKNLKDNGTSWEVYLTNPAEVTDPNKLQTVIYFPVE